MEIWNIANSAKVWNLKFEKRIGMYSKSLLEACNFDLKFIKSMQIWYLVESIAS